MAFAGHCDLQEDDQWVQDHEQANCVFEEFVPSEVVHDVVRDLEPGVKRKSTIGS